MSTSDTLPVLPPTATVDDVWAASDEHGAVIVTDLIDPISLSAILDELTPHLDSTEPVPRYGGGYPATGYGHGTRRVQGLVARGDAVIEFLAHPLVLAWAGRQLAHHTGGFQLSSSELIEIGPDEDAQPLHADAALLWPDAYRPDKPEVMVTCLFALNDFTERNGATRVALGSQRQDVRDLDPSSPPTTVAAEMHAGSAVLFTGNVWHGGGANNTATEPRRGLAVSYAAGWLRPEEAICLTVSLERARRLPPVVQQLIGYASYRPHRGDGDGHRLWGFDKGDASAALTGGPIR